MLTELLLVDHTERVSRSPRIPLTRITLLAGPNGSGKSTVLDAIHELVMNPERVKWTHENMPVQIAGECKAVYCMSFERDNPRTQDSATIPSNQFFTAAMLRFRSHGQSNYALLKGALAHDEFDVMVLDEPESALDLDGLLMLREALVKTDKQIILSTHSPLLLSLIDQKGIQGVSAQEFGPEGYVERVMGAYRSIFNGRQAPRPAKRLAIGESIFNPKPEAKVKVKKAAKPKGSTKEPKPAAARSEFGAEAQSEAKPTARRPRVLPRTPVLRT